MAFQFHTYGPSCYLRQSKEDRPDLESIPELKAQFFHYSRQPIDELLSKTLYTAEPIIRPFSAYDNEQLEAKWQTFLKHRAEEKVDNTGDIISESTITAPVPIAKVTDAKELRRSFLSAESADSNEGSEFHDSRGSVPEGSLGAKLQELEERQKRISRISQSMDLATTPESMTRGRISEIGEGVSFSTRSGPVETQILDHPASERVTPSDSRPKMLPRVSTVIGFPKTETVVGLSRLHVVEFPDMNIRPIYWDQSIDIAPVMRGTWFYQASMQPVETPIANLLERGYQYMKPWTDTYQDEIASCLAVGPDAEKHLVHHLLPEIKDYAAQNQNDQDVLKTDRYYKARGSLTKTPRVELLQRHSTCGVIYADRKSAQILRPNQLPSTSRGRKPLRDITKRKEVGIVVVRGFDHRAWDRRHPLKGVYPPTQYQKTNTKSRNHDVGLKDRRSVCHACEAEREDPNVTDLVLVVHGIGQKLSERMESFAFTHSITTLRRDVNELLLSEQVRPILREDLGSIICLPVNWRSAMKDEPAKEAADDEEEGFFTLDDVTVPHMLETRAFINDVFVDIPYYMSNKHDDIVSAVAREANKIYTAWCKNHPNFHNQGRVHIVGHSLGSVITMDILSNQPTTLPKDKSPLEYNDSTFNFDTKNFFCAGSPLGFFLHLNHARLRPREGRIRENIAIPAETKLGSSRGEFGCPAVDNIYNLVHPQDPVAYRLNPCVDIRYAATLKEAVMPAIEGGWFSRRALPLQRPITSRKDSSTRPLMRNFPSTVEMDIHNFSKEETAEKRMYLLNENGQIDWLLPLPGSFGIPYLNILYAHSSYWTSKDFVRFLVVEIGRATGRSEALPILRARKKLER